MHEPVSGREYLTRFAKASVVCTLIVTALILVLAIIVVTTVPIQIGRPAFRTTASPTQPILVFDARPDLIDLVKPGANAASVQRVVCRIPQSAKRSVAIAGARVFLLAGGPSNDRHLYEWNVATGEAFHIMGPEQLGSTFAIAGMGDDLFARDNDGVAHIDLQAGTLTQMLSLPWTAPANAFFQTPIHTGFAATQTELAFLAAPGVVGFLNPQMGNVDRIAIDGVTRVTSAISDAAHVKCGRSFQLIDRSPSRPSAPRWSSKSLSECSAVLEVGGNVWGVHSGGGYSRSWLVNLDSGGIVQLDVDGVFGVIPLPPNSVP